MENVQVKIMRESRMGGKRWMALLFAMFLSSILVGCAATRSQVEGTFDRPTEKNLDADQVSVFFQLRHLKQQHGLDASPKLQAQGVKDFDNIFLDALKEISNISKYATFTESPADVNNPKRREECKTLRDEHDYTVKIDFLEETSFKEQSLSGIVSILSLTLIPVPFTWDYTITADIYEKDGKPVRTYRRKATLYEWWQVLLMAAYPFYPTEGKREEIYKESLHDIFRQIETERILKSE